MSYGSQEVLNPAPLGDPLHAVILCCRPQTRRLALAPASSQQGAVLLGSMVQTRSPKPRVLEKLRGGRPLLWVRLQSSRYKVPTTFVSMEQFAKIA